MWRDGWSLVLRGPPRPCRLRGGSLTCRSYRPSCLAPVTRLWMSALGPWMTCVWSSARGCDGVLCCESGIGCDAFSSSPWSESANGAFLVMRSASASFCGHENGTFYALCSVIWSSSSSFPLSPSLLVSLSAPGSLSPAFRPQFSLVGPVSL